MAKKLTEEKAPRIDAVLRVAFLAVLVVGPLIIVRNAPLETTKWFVLQLGGSGIFAVWYGLRVARGRLRLPSDFLTLLLVASLIPMVVSLLGATNSWLGLIQLSRRLAMLCIFLLVAVLMKDSRRQVIWVLGGTGIATSIYGIAQHFGFDFIPWREHSHIPLERGISFFGHATFAGSYLVATLPILLGIAYSSSNRGIRAASGVGALAMFYHLSFSGARSATLGLIAAGAVVVLTLFLHNRRRKAISWKPLIGALCTIAVVGGLLGAQAWRVKGSDLLPFREASGSLRLYTWETATRMFLEHPVAGIGAGNYEIVLPSYWNEVEAVHFAKNGSIANEAHNEYFEIAAEQGFPGIAILIGILVCASVYCVDVFRLSHDTKERAYALALLASLVAMSSDALFIFNWQSAGPALVFFVVLGLIQSQHAQLIIAQPGLAQGAKDVQGNVGNVVV